jgi:hypothetical protein
MSKLVRCRVGIVFYKVQAKIAGAVIGVLRDVVGRRSFLRVHPHLLDRDGTPRATAWPFGSPRTAVTCVCLVVWLALLDVVALDFWVSSINVLQ